MKRLQKCLFALLIGCLTISANADTTVGGNVNGTWDLAGSPYIVEENILVVAGDSLTIEAGVEVRFNNALQLTVNGTLLVEGESGNPVTFTGDVRRVGGLAINGWRGIRLVNADDISSINYAIIENSYARGAGAFKNGGGLYIENTSPLIANSIIRNNRASTQGGGIYLLNSNALLRDNQILNNSANNGGGSASGGGVAINGASPSLINNTISANSVFIAGSYTTPYGRGGGLYINNANVLLNGNVIAANSIDAENNSYSRGGALYLGNASVDIINNTIAGNSINNGVQGYYAFKEGGGLYLYSADAVLLNSLLAGNSHDGVFGSPYGIGNNLAVAYSNVEGGLGGINSNVQVSWLAGNITGDPNFVDAANGNYQLQNDSNAIDAGTAVFNIGGRQLLNLNDADFAGNAPDQGALEFGGERAGGENTPPPEEEEPPAASTEIHVQDLSVNRQVIFWHLVNVNGTVVISDANNNFIAGATVTIEYSGAIQGQLTAVTGDNGVATLQTPDFWAQGSESVCFTVTGVSKNDLTYNPGADVVTTLCD